MKMRSDKGFSIIELLIVCVVAGVIATIAIPYLQRAIRAAENGSTFATLRAVASTQASFYGTNTRYGNLVELNNIMSGNIGSTIGNEVHRGKFVFTMTPSSPTPDQLRDGFIINATRNVAGEGIIYQFELTHTGEIRQISPAP